MRQEELRFVSLVGDPRRCSPVQAIANTLDELAPDDVEVGFLGDIGDWPHFDRASGDLSLPLDIAAMSASVAKADAVVIVAPEALGPLSGALDWLSSMPSRPLAGKAVAIVIASTDASGGTGTCRQLRRILAALDAVVLGQTDVVLAEVGGKIDNHAACLRDEGARRHIGSQLAALASLVRERRS